MSTNDLLQWVQQYYASCCNGDWEHGEGVSIETLDNPGWYVRINLQDTTLARQAFERIEIEHDEQNWYFCWIEDCKFHGAGGVYNLITILTIFRDWVERVDPLVDRA